MRIIGGKNKGFILKPRMNGWPTRPTTDVAKEGLFNILMNELDFENLLVLDLFGGTGSHSFEFLSRGCQHVTYVDQHRQCAVFVTETAERLGYSEHIKVVRQNAYKFIKTGIQSFDYIFAGPPYSLNWLPQIPKMIFDHKLLNRGGLFVLEHNNNHHFSDLPQFDRERNYGQTHFSFFRLV